MVGAQVKTPEGTKYCSKCDSVLPVSAFGKKKAMRDGMTTQCRSCINRYIGGRDSVKALAKRENRYIGPNPDCASDHIASYECVADDGGRCGPCQFWVDKKEEVDAHILKYGDSL